MRVRISYTVTVTDEQRRAINHHYDRPGLATREQVKDHFYAYGAENCVLDDMVRDYHLSTVEQQP